MTVFVGIWRRSVTRGVSAGIPLPPPCSLQAKMIITGKARGWRRFALVHARITQKNTAELLLRGTMRVSEIPTTRVSVD